ncbi:IS200/IS605 family transposase [Thauera sp. SDU_THAU2]|uniref:IS200/IS605 family transposase n=1 Tax=Thauera sp. SDU_THAU2 TaxID=3136633 RepID=UPI004055027C
MDERSQSYSTWDCKYHVVFASKYRTKRLYGDARRELGDLLHTFARQKGCEIREGHLMPDHVHMLISIPPKYSVSSIVGFLKGKTATYVVSAIFRSCRWMRLGRLVSIMEVMDTSAMLPSHHGAT